MTNKKRERALDNKCPACSAPILYDPSSGKWKCKYCDSEFTLEEMKKHNNASNDVNNKKEEVVEKLVVDDNINYVTYSCKNCGAEIVADEETASTFCVYCGNTAILKNKLSGKFAPDLIIPFKVEKQKAIDAFKGLSKGRVFVPKSFTDPSNIEKITGVYIPFWLYDINVSGSLNADAKKITTWTRGNTRYTKTDVYKVYRTGSMNYYRVPVDGSTRFANDIMNSIEPFNYEELEPYNHAYLSGFLSEKYNIDNEKSFEDAKNRALTSTRDKMFEDMGYYDSKTIVENTLAPNKKKVEYALLPVWMVNVKYKEEFYLFAMNGQTGEFIGNIPLDKPKVVKYMILIFLIVLVVLSLASYIIYVLGGRI